MGVASVLEYYFISVSRRKNLTEITSFPLPNLKLVGVISLTEMSPSTQNAMEEFVVQ